MGPVCSRNYYNPQHEPTDQQVMNALGLLAISDLPQHIIDSFIKVVDNDHVNARLGCNLIVYWASCNYDNRSEVFKCAAIIRSLGYDALADKLETDRSECRIEDRGALDGSIVLYVGTKARFNHDMAKIPGATLSKQDKLGSKVRWDIPNTQIDHFLCVLGVHYGNKLACGDHLPGGQRVWTIAPKTWRDLQIFRAPPKPVAPVVPDPPPAQPTGGGGPGKVCINLSSPGCLDVHTPYNADFVNALKQRIPYRDRQWVSAGKYWSVRSHHFATVANLISDHYGAEL